MARGRPRRDGSGGGRRFNAGRGCGRIREFGQGMAYRARRFFRRD